MSARLVTLIETDIEVRGEGTPDDVCRRVRQWWTTDGTLVVELDPCAVLRGAEGDTPNDSDIRSGSGKE